MDDRLQAGKPPRYVASHARQLSLLPYAAREISTDQTAVMFCLQLRSIGSRGVHSIVNQKTGHYALIFHKVV